MKHVIVGHLAFIVAAQATADLAPIWWMSGVGWCIAGGIYMLTGKDR